MLPDRVLEELAAVPPEWILVAAIGALVIVTARYLRETRRLVDKHAEASRQMRLPRLRLVRRPYEPTIGLGNLGAGPAISVKCQVVVSAATDGIDERETTVRLHTLREGDFFPFDRGMLAALQDIDGGIYDTYDEVTITTEYETLFGSDDRITETQTYALEELVRSRSDDLRVKPLVDRP